MSGADLPRSAPGAALAGELAAVIGDEATARLFLSFAGRTVYVPAAPSAGHPLTAAIGAAAAARLGAYYGGVCLTFPLTAAKRRRAVELAAAGHSADAIARELWTTRRHVFRLLRAAAQGQQPDLFAQGDDGHLSRGSRRG